MGNQDQSIFQRTRELAQQNPNLPLTWENVITLSAEFRSDEASRRGFEQTMEQIQSTRTGQQLLRDILLHRDQPMVMQLSDTMQIGSQAVYDSFSHSVTVSPDFFTREDFSRGIGIERDQYFVHELGHAATAPKFMYLGSGMTTMQDFLFIGAREEQKAEQVATKYKEELGFQSRNYTGDYLGGEIKTIIKAGFPKIDIAKSLVRSSLTQSTIDGLSKEAALERLHSDTQEVQRRYGVDLSETVRDYLNSPAPEISNEDLPIIGGPKKPESSLANTSDEPIRGNSPLSALTK